MQSPRIRLWIPVLAVAALMLTGCAVNKKMTVGATALLIEDVARASYRQSDLEVIRQGMPAYLMLMDGMVTAWPGNARLLIAASQAYSSYATAFAETQDEAYALALYAKARDYALQALSQRGIDQPLKSSYDDFEKAVGRRGVKDVPYMFWAALSWGNWISLNQGSMAAMAQLPRVEALMKRVLTLDEGYHYGGPHLFMGIWFASRPPIAGGDMERAQTHFLRAIALGDDKFLMARVYYAFHYARRVLDADLFAATLQAVIETPADIEPDLTLINTVARERAENLLAKSAEYFE